MTATARKTSRLIALARQYRGSTSELPSRVPGQLWSTFACNFRNRTTARLFKSAVRWIGSRSRVHPSPAGFIVYVTVDARDW